MPDERTPSGYRRYDLVRLRPEQVHRADSDGKTLVYARSSSDSSDDTLESQKQILSRYCATQGWDFDVITDRGSSKDDHIRGLKRLLERILADDFARLVIAHQSQLGRFGAELVFAVCEAKHVEVLILNQGEGIAIEDDEVSDLSDLIKDCSTTLYPSRRRRQYAPANGLHQAVDQASS